MKSRATIKWVGLALVGLLIAAGVSIAASRLASEEIGLASEPIEAGNALAPTSRAPAARRHQQPPRGEKPATTPAPAPAPTVTTPQAAPPAAEPETSPAPSPPSGSESFGGQDGEHGGGGGADD